jgi:hypothetical protein
MTGENEKPGTSVVAFRHPQPLTSRCIFMTAELFEPSIFLGIFELAKLVVNTILNNATNVTGLC